MSRPANFLSGLSLDRAGPQRRDSGFVASAWAHDEARVVPVWRSKHPVIRGNPPKLVFTGNSGQFDENSHPLVLLGTSGSASYFSVDLSEAESPHHVLGLDEDVDFLSLREIGALIAREDAALLAYANGMASWHRRHQYCGSCGSATRSEHAGHVRRCSSKSCGLQHFPRTDPAVIVLVSHNDEALLGRQPGWPEGVYSTLAGFVEPGESLEEAVAREVFEESGVPLEEIEYHSSQPWPFPSSLMVGFTATATSQRISLQSDELEDARWFSSEELRRERGLKLPSTISIARRLIEDWLDSLSPNA